MEIVFDPFVFVFIYCVGKGIATLISFSDGSDPYFLVWKNGKHAVHERKNGRRGFFPARLLGVFLF